MIITPYEGQLLIVLQPDHGTQTGLFAEAWGNEEVAPVEPNGASVRLAATHHDDGWAGWERRPTLDYSGRPVQFLELSPEEHIPLYRYGIDRAAQHDPRTGLLVSMHGAGLYNSRYGTFQLTEQHFNDTEQALVDEFLNDMAALQTRLATRARVHSVRRHVSEDLVVRHQYLLLQVWDRLSLQYLYRLAGDARIAPLPGVGQRTDLICRRRGAFHLELDPFPFTVSSAVFPVRAAVVPDRQYVTPEDFLEELASAGSISLECRASRAT